MQIQTMVTITSDDLDLWGNMAEAIEDLDKQAAAEAIVSALNDVQAAVLNKDMDNDNPNIAGLCYALMMIDPTLWDFPSRALFICTGDYA